jgi:hypothetical protein
MTMTNIIQSQESPYHQQMAQAGVLLEVIGATADRADEVLTGTPAGFNPLAEPGAAERQVAATRAVLAAINAAVLIDGYGTPRTMPRAVAALVTPLLRSVHTESAALLMSLEAEVGRASTHTDGFAAAMEALALLAYGTEAVLALWDSGGGES